MPNNPTSTGASYSSGRPRHPPVEESHHFDITGNDPNLDLREPDFQLLLKLAEKSLCVGAWNHIDGQSQVVIFKSLTGVGPDTAKNLRRSCHRTELGNQLIL